MAQVFFCASSKVVCRTKHLSERRHGSVQLLFSLFWLQNYSAKQTRERERERVRSMSLVHCHSESLALAAPSTRSAYIMCQILPCLVTSSPRLLFGLHVLGVCRDCAVSVKALYSECIRPYLKCTCIVLRLHGGCI